MPPSVVTAVPVVATLDLHGLRKEAAIRQLTLFLEEAVRQHAPSQQRRVRRRNSQQQRQGGETPDSTLNSIDYSFYPNQAVWVSVITGTGSHSLHGTPKEHAVVVIMSICCQMMMLVVLIRLVPVLPFSCLLSILDENRSCITRCGQSPVGKARYVISTTIQGLFYH